MPTPEVDCPDCLSAALLLAAETGCYEEGMGVDEMLQRFAGEFGPWQLRQFLLTSIAWALNALHTMVVIFAEREPARPDHCTTGFPAGWWAVSTAEEWGLACGGNFYMVGLAQSAFFAGAMIGAAIFGHLSDSFLGRKGALTIACIFNAAFSLLTAFSPTFPFYVSLRLLTGLSTGGVGLSAFVLATEPVGPSLRASVAMSTFYFSSVGAVAIALAALFLPSWRFLYAANSSSSLLFLLFAIPFISESPRWHLVRRNLPAAMNVMHAIAKTNGSSIPDHASLKMDSCMSRPSSTSIIDVLRSPVTRPRLFLAILINLLGSVVYYGLTLNVGNLGTDIHFGVILNAVAELPAYALTGIAVRWCGRRLMATVTMAVSGALCIAGGMFGGKGELATAARLGCAAVGIFLEAAGFDVLYIYTAELFPTVVRNAALGCVTVAGQMGAMAAPMVVAMGGASLPFIVFGVCGVAAGSLARGLPETFNRPLYDTMEGLEGGEGKSPEKNSASILV